jgi:hypothetical protein
MVVNFTLNYAVPQFGIWANARSIPGANVFTLAPGLSGANVNTLNPRNSGFNVFTLAPEKNKKQPRLISGANVNTLAPEFRGFNVNTLAPEKFSSYEIDAGPGISHEKIIPRMKIIPLLTSTEFEGNSLRNIFSKGIHTRK